MNSDTHLQYTIYDPNVGYNYSVHVWSGYDLEGRFAHVCFFCFVQEWRRRFMEKPLETRPCSLQTKGFQVPTSARMCNSPFPYTHGLRRSASTVQPQPINKLLQKEYCTTDRSAHWSSPGIALPIWPWLWVIARSPFHSGRWTSLSSLFCSFCMVNQGPTVCSR